MAQDIRASFEDRVLTVVLDRADKRNALTHDMYTGLAEALERAASDPEVRVVVLHAEGALFTAGNDLSDFAQLAGDDRPSGDWPVTRFLRALIRCPVPLIAAVQGRAVGVGTTMLLHCDLVVMADDASLTAPFVDLALVPEACSTLLLPQRLGHARAFAMVALGQPLSAQEALSAGMATSAVPSDRVGEEASRLAGELVARSARSLAETKRLMRDVPALLERMETEIEVFAQRLRSPEAQEALEAFAQKRTPDFAQFE
ncbi:enoyl-CoA hydratase [Kocuria palustris]|uniref:enoyl-CoA hydratase n=1 Tax=Kocuria palustris TaxID=71999 RepID=UPI00119D091E|nr:enoyl-CoA hydratase [Kocuria palustris]